VLIDIFFCSLLLKDVYDRYIDLRLRLGGKKNKLWNKEGNGVYFLLWGRAARIKEGDKIKRM